MELWIRSQDGECLMKVDRVDYDYCATLHRIVVNGYKVLVGVYSTRERAMQVLDEIQNILQPRYIMHEPIHAVDYRDLANSLTDEICLHTTQQVEMELKQVGQFVYQMPKE